MTEQLCGKITHMRSLHLRGRQSTGLQALLDYPLHLCRQIAVFALPVVGKVTLRATQNHYLTAHAVFRSCSLTQQVRKPSGTRCGIASLAHGQPVARNRSTARSDCWSRP